jgi:hypothetical protein
MLSGMKPGKAPGTLAELLGTPDPRPEPEQPQDDFQSLAEIGDAEKFCKAIVATREFRQYIMHGIALGDLPPAVVTRILDHAWGKPPDKLEVTGRDGQPIETVTEVRRTIVPAPAKTVGDKPTKESVH